MEEEIEGRSCECRYRKKCLFRQWNRLGSLPRVSAGTCLRRKIAASGQAGGADLIIPRGKHRRAGNDDDDDDDE